MDTRENVPDTDFCEMNGLISDVSEVSEFYSVTAEAKSDSEPREATGSPPSLTQLWASVKAELERSLAPSAFEVWISPIIPSEEGQTLKLSVENKIFLDWVRDNYLGEMRASLRKLCQAAGRPEPGVELQVTPPAPPAQPALATLAEPGALAQLASPPPKPLPAPTPRPLRPADGTLRINPNFTFANFIGGDANRVALEASKAFARGESLGSDILLITGDHGLGKSHLTQAIAQNYLTANPDKRVFYLAAEDFSTELVVSLKKQVMDSFKSKYRRGCDLLLLEEFNFFSGKRKFEEEFSHTLDLLLNQGKKIVLTSWEDLRSLTQLSPQLRSKIVSSLFTPIGPPDFETRVAILEHKAKKADLVLSRRVIEFMAEKLQNDVRLLEGCLMTLSANCRFSRQPISLEMAQQCLSFVETAASDELTMEKITRMVCLNYNISETEIISNSRRSRILEAREMAMYLTRNLTNKTLAEIGSAFHRTHSTTLSSYRRIEKLLKKSQKLRDTVDFLTSQLGGPKTLKNG